MSDPTSPPKIVYGFAMRTAKAVLSIAETFISRVTENVIEGSNVLESMSADLGRCSCAATQTEGTESSSLSRTDLRRAVDHVWGSNTDAERAEIVDEMYNYLRPVSTVYPYAHPDDEPFEAPDDYDYIKRLNWLLINQKNELKKQLAQLTEAYRKGVEERTNLETELHLLRHKIDQEGESYVREDCD